jgi:hypothetical protein
MKKDFQKTGEKIEKLLPKLRQECLAFLSEELSKKGSICFDDDAPDDFDPIYVSYDGGAHPEYASNAFSTVYDVHLNDKGDIELCIEETDEYGIDRCTTMEVYDIACLVHRCIYEIE